MLLHIPNVLDAAQLAHVVDALASAEWVDGRRTVGAQGAQVKRNEQLDDACALRAQLGDIVLAALARNPLYFAAALPLRTLPPRFNRYSGGGEYGLHVDGAVMALAAPAPAHATTASVADAPTAPSASAPQWLRSDVSCTLFLSAPESYDGGELIVSDTYGEHAVKLPAGDLIVYPASSLHRVAPLTRGTRLACFFWVQSLVRDDAQRRTLFELDTAIRTLTDTGADRAAVVQLTGVYHNLLRRWSQT